ncbi:hypothetical protein C0992_000235 [Termitomyces sp. T32_za158]|nr:hypothetical protein C0992_000235 [Termitomyces sp. T32_za158]
MSGNAGKMVSANILPVYQKEKINNQSDITDYQEAIDIFNAEINYFKMLGTKEDQISKSQSKGALAFLSYLGSYLQVCSFWLSWSKAGVLEAANRLGVSASDVPRTNNHLKSFNGRINKKYFSIYEHTGHLPCLDLWVSLLITRVLPDFFAQLKARKAEEEYRHRMRQIESMIYDMVEYEGPEEVASSNNVLACGNYNEGFSLKMDANGEGCSFTSWRGINERENGAAKEVVAEDDHLHAVVPLLDAEQKNSPSPMQWEDPVDEEDIRNVLKELDVNINVESSPTRRDISMFSLSASPIIHAQDAKPISASHLPLCDSNSNAQAIAMQEMLVMQEQLGQTLRCLQNLNISDDVLEQYTTPYLHPRVFGGIPDPIHLPGTLKRTSMVGDSRGDENDVLLPLLVQKKERQKESFALR